MTKQCEDYGYDQCVEFQQAEAVKRGQAEDEANAVSN